MRGDDPTIAPADIEHFVFEDPTCLSCGREIQAGRTWCQYCGVFGEQEHGKSCQDEVHEESFRLHRSLWPFVSAALVLGAVGAVFLSRHGDPGTAWMDPRAGTILGYALLTFGPARLLFRVFRGRPHVRIEPESGVVLPNGRELAWSQIERVENRRGLFRPTPDLAAWSRTIRGITDVGTNAGLNFGKFLLPFVLGVAFALLIVHVVAVSVLYTLSPWPPRVVLHLRNGERVGLSDMEEPGRFVRMVRSKRDAPE